jgi:hypothetical protein
MRGLISHSDASELRPSTIRVQNPKLLPQQGIVALMRSTDTIAHMQSRIERCRRLAKLTTDDTMRDALLAMAGEIEADVEVLKQELLSTGRGEVAF